MNSSASLESWQLVWRLLRIVDRGDHLDACLLIPATGSRTRTGRIGNDGQNPIRLHLIICISKFGILLCEMSTSFSNLAHGRGADQGLRSWFTRPQLSLQLSGVSFRSQGA
ncbi:hypothetical protein CC85DRAFT_46351 [Cutaneotrichosporon oleaginosum]|uniref:Uncharacterized protein n=1 Tax=Cutaneotrichosporon oleaginosum TaxID=879819 RepID=A0A0J0XRD9_9TREE|nr:uncharacterized protein CC85DRAFT_46351 [Cutaneotrichosporon oleaginosum]KLT43653.1 hypothetical protein CC85DRAFT_46351 [Cutaneotrichosporon oleaginosum]TXT12681.1 hypothetical protein COLE_03091 [Cutaneotrichosporon oleaginosum]